MCKSFFKKIFTKEDAPLLKVETTSNAKKQSKRKRVKNDSSTDKSNNVIGDGNNIKIENNNIKIENNHNNSIYGNIGSAPNAPQLSVKARWLKFIPFKIECRKTGIDNFNVLVPSEIDYIEPCIEVCNESYSNKDNALYLRFGANLLIHNIELKTIEINGEIYDINQPLFGVLDIEKAAVIMGDQWAVGKEDVLFSIYFECEKERFVQVFKFTTTDGKGWFNMLHYNEPVPEIDWEIRQNYKRLRQNH